MSTRSNTKLPDWVRREALRLAASGLGTQQIAARLGTHRNWVTRVVGPTGGVIRKELWEPRHGRLSFDDRAEIKSRLDRGESFAAIGRALGRSTSTISREVGGTAGRSTYRPGRAHRRAFEAAKRPKPTKLSTNPQLCAQVETWLLQWWSPKAIAEKLVREFPDQPGMHVSHETIYKTLYVQGRGELRRELTRCLRTGRSRRKQQTRVETRGRIPDMTLIADRPPEVDDRRVPGHWEGDLMVGKDGKSAIVVLSERTTSIVMLAPLPNGRTASEVREAISTKIMQLPQHLRRTLTWDQGVEMSEHLKLADQTGLDIYFCDPHSPWQKGQVEQINKLLRQYLPRGTDLTHISEADLNDIADSLNNRPRAKFDYNSPSEQFAQLVATTD